MKLIVGLGNPGEKYKNNRHNVGFMFVDYFLETYNSQLITQGEKIQFKKNKYLFSEIALCKKLQASGYKLPNLILVKPMTFMNNSGQAVSACVTSYKLRVSKNLIIVHDDLDIPLGKFKINQGIRPKLHNGLESIENHLHTKDFLRIRIGVDNRTPDQWIDGEKYVLSDFNENQKEILTNLFPKILTSLKISFNNH